MKLIYTALFALAATAVNACDSTLCKGATVLRVVPFDFTVARLGYLQSLLLVNHPPNPEKMVHNIRTKDEFQDALKKYPIVVVDFYSTQSAESKHIAATFAHAYELDKFKDFRFVKVDIDDLKGLAEELGVSQPATFHMYKNGEKINDLQSEHKEDLIQFLETGL
ncbi:thioredoxin [Fusarium fujikuroi]|nr:thioredoxin [Fusarium fujikuroi]